ncbi:WD repeat-containing protein on Y chromosome-like isoform X5 [Monodelphis domestica]|uniref:WD repeat-containing protein on Y chromosome-like isoform X5 n=1 Tax=Monodelphis domestica TaxID=13616 RepID=UPI0024E2083D|nr:WD repeat-containing protein on Y chromosome-like isoform X5 [Monodelphis domestica]
MKKVQKGDYQPETISNKKSPSPHQSEENSLEEKLHLNHLKHLEQLFTAPKGEVLEKNPECKKLSKKQKTYPSGSLTLQELKNALTELLGTEYWNGQTELLFNKIQTAHDNIVDWSEFCSHLLLQYRKRDVVEKTKDTFFQGKPLIRHCSQNKQEPTTRILAIFSPSTTHSFVTVSKGGILSFWDNNLQLQKTYEMLSDAVEAPMGKKKIKVWTTDAVYMPNVHKIAVATTSRKIYFFEVSLGPIFEDFHLFALNYIPTSVFYWYNTESVESCSVLLWGDDHGGVSVLRFLHPNKSLYEKSLFEQTGFSGIYMQDIENHCQFLRYTYIRRLHQDSISQIQYVPEDLCITSSGNSQTSLVIMDMDQKRKAYTWKIKRGIKCFDFCKSLNLLVSGGADCCVRVWNRFVPSLPTAMLRGHSLPILGLAIQEEKGQIFSYSKDAVLKIWDMSYHSCLHTVTLKFPHSQSEDALEQGTFPFLFLQKPFPLILISYIDYMGMLRLPMPTQSETNFATPHKAPLCGTVYNAFFHQVVTGCHNSTIAVWDVETGMKQLILNNTHGEEELTCMALDNSGRRLITAARNGTIKVWDIQRGHILHKLEVVEDAEVTGLVPIRKHIFLTVGWNRKIILYDCSKLENVYVPADKTWKGGQLHKEDILAVDYCPPLDLLATASFDGEIIVWNVETQRPHHFVRKVSRESSLGPVNKLLFLQHRCTDQSLQKAAILISAETGNLHWWSLFGKRMEYGKFYAPLKEDISVTGLSATKNNQLLVTGDSSGFIQVWDISDYGTTLSSSSNPLLLRSWKAHSCTVVSVEHFSYGSDSFIISGSSDGTSGLWTAEGTFVGLFGQEKKWSLRVPATYSSHRNAFQGMPVLDSKLEDTTIEKDRDLCEKRSESRKGKDMTEIHSFTDGQKGDHMPATEGNPKAADWKLPTSLGAIPLQLTSPNANSQKGGGQNWELPPQLTNSFRIHEGPFQHYMESKLGKRLAGRKERRCRFGEINIHKCCQFGQICSPFQALATPEMRRLILPQDLPISNQMEYLGFSPTVDPAFQDFIKTSEDLTEEDSQNEREKPVTPMKTPLFPPIVKTVRSSDMK